MFLNVQAFPHITAAMVVAEVKLAALAAVRVGVVDTRVAVEQEAVVTAAEGSVLDSGVAAATAAGVACRS